MTALLPRDWRCHILGHKATWIRGRNPHFNSHRLPSPGYLDCSRCTCHPYFGATIVPPRHMEMIVATWKQARSRRHDVCGGGRVSSRLTDLTVGGHMGLDPSTLR